MLLDIFPVAKYDSTKLRLANFKPILRRLAILVNNATSSSPRDSSKFGLASVGLSWVSEVLFLAMTDYPENV